MLNRSHVIPKNGQLAIAPSDDGLAIADLQPGADHPSLKLCEFAPWEGDTSREDVMTAQSAELKLKNRLCASVLPATEYSILSIEAPNVPDDEIQSAIRWQIRDMIDFDADEAVVEIFPAPQGNGVQQKRRLYVVVTRAQTIKALVDLVTHANTKLDIIDIPELALRNIAAKLSEDDAGLAMVHLSSERGMVLISRQKQLYFARTMDIGINTLNKVAPSVGSLALADNDAFDRIVLEIQRSLDYYDRYFYQPPIAGVVFAPLPEPIPGLFEYVQASLGIAVRELDIAEVVDVEQTIDRSKLAQCVVAIGAALRERH